MSDCDFSGPEPDDPLSAEWTEILIEAAFHRYREGTDDLQTAVKTLSDLAKRPRAETPLVRLIGGKLKGASLYE